MVDLGGILGLGTFILFILFLGGIVWLYYWLKGSKLAGWARTGVSAVDTESKQLASAGKSLTEAKDSTDSDKKTSKLEQSKKRLTKVQSELDEDEQTTNLTVQKAGSIVKELKNKVTELDSLEQTDAVKFAKNKTTGDFQTLDRLMSKLKAKQGENSEIIKETKGKISTLLSNINTNTSKEAIQNAINAEKEIEDLHQQRLQINNDIKTLVTQITSLQKEITSTIDNAKPT
ncbi:hypothetical protein CL616_00615 [archaeon]|nr:hypothetical protein [archaeon]|tara:strand:+ start:48 stop:740 length:693 start_codon:yes stop_codon:yes gene_type:complete